MAVRVLLLRPQAVLRACVGVPAYAKKAGKNETGKFVACRAGANPPFQAEILRVGTRPTTVVQHWN